MSDDGSKSKPKRRWRQIATGVIAIALLCFAVDNWLNRRWVDERYVGVWKVDYGHTHPRPDRIDPDMIWILHADGSGRWLVDHGEREWGERSNSGTWRWWIDRSGFHFEDTSYLRDSLRERLRRIVGGLSRLSWSSEDVPRLQSPYPQFVIRSIDRSSIQLVGSEQHPDDGFPTFGLTRMNANEIPPTEP